MIIKILIALVPFIAGMLSGGLLVHVTAPDPVAAIQADQAPVRKQAEKDIDNMKRELRQHKPSSPPSSWR